MKTSKVGPEPDIRAVDEVSRRNVETIGRIQKEAEGHRTVSELVADGFARAVGSWTFIIIQSVLLTFWVIANVIHVIKPWDPYPFILLNLALSFQAAYASPIIMMSQKPAGPISGSAKSPRFADRSAGRTGRHSNTPVTA